MSVESVTVIRTLQGVRERSTVEGNQNAASQTDTTVEGNQNAASQTDMETAIALGVRAVKNQFAMRVDPIHIEKLRERINNGSYHQDSLAMARKMLEIEPED
ncbi:MAG TPA: flagellar biosynthesis anti-sigma factor FlgM [Ktedonobacteraceae bacterium]|nr:flagellar biosynthesis anti-sigma factor FlgM [Ktedonobacteraceae bacterium]